MLKARAIWMTRKSRTSIARTALRLSVQVFLRAAVAVQAARVANAGVVDAGLERAAVAGLDNSGKRLRNERGLFA